MGALVKPDGLAFYVQTRKSMQADSANNILVPGRKIPSEDEVAIRFGVSRMTVPQGIFDLLDEGLLYRPHGIGTFVARRLIEQDHTRLESFKDFPSFIKSALYIWMTVHRSNLRTVITGAIGIP